MALAAQNPFHVRLAAPPTVDVAALSLGATLSAKFVLLGLSGFGAGALRRVRHHHRRRIVVLAVPVFAHDPFLEVVKIGVEVDRLLGVAILGVVAEEDALDLLVEKMRTFPSLPPLNVEDASTTAAPNAAGNSAPAAAGVSNNAVLA